VPPTPASSTRSNLSIWPASSFSTETPRGTLAYPDTLVGTDCAYDDSQRLWGWWNGRRWDLKAEAAMLGQPISMLIPQVLGVRLTGRMPGRGDRHRPVLTITERLRNTAWWGSLSSSSVGPRTSDDCDRATLGNMCPEYGATVAIFPIDAMTLD